MKKYLLIILAIFGSFSFTMAQNGNGREKIQALKVAFITQKLQSYCCGSRKILASL